MTKDDLISRQAAIDAITNYAKFLWEKFHETGNLAGMIEAIEGVPSAQPEKVCIAKITLSEEQVREAVEKAKSESVQVLSPAQPEQRYTEEELRMFQHCISLLLLSKRSAQRWQYDEDRATEIKFLERLYEKVGADMRGEEDEQRRSD